MSQDLRLLAVETPLGKKLRLRSISGSEEISRLFSYQLIMECPQGELTRDEVVNQLVGKKVSVRISLDGGERNLSGYLVRIASDFSEDGGTLYRAEMVPFFWFATQTSDCKIFQDESVTDIIKKVMADLGFGGNLEMATKGTYDKLTYCVQYRETDFNFLSRLMEQYGLFYYFKHTKDDCKLVCSDDISAFPKVPGPAIDYPLSKSVSTDVKDHITDWEHQFEFVSGAWAQTDYNFEKPKDSLLSSVPTKIDAAAVKKYEIFDFPGEYEKKGDGDKWTKVRMEEEELPYDTIQGTSSCRVFEAGKRFGTSAQHPSSDKSKEFLLTSVNFRAKSDSYSSGKNASGESYSNSFTCVPAKVAYRPKRTTPKPVVNGLQTATVVGPKGEEIYTDEYGRVKVQFHWDRYGKKDDHSSCWIRVSQAIAGKKWGFMAIPRIGQEVVVDFLEGDPDRPLIVGTVYNGEQMPAYDPKSMASRISLKTNSTKGGEGFNELTFEDKKDSEMIFLHAQKDLDVRVLNDEKRRVYGNHHEVVGWEKDGKKGGSQFTRVYQDRQTNIKRHEIEHVEGNLQLMVGNGEESSGGNVAAVIEKSVAISIGKEGLECSIEGDKKEKIDGAVSLMVKGDVSQQTDGNQSLKVKGERMEEANSLSIKLKTMGNVKADAKLGIEAGTEVHVKSGATLVLEAGAALTLKVGGSFVSINPAGVFIQGPLVGINSGGAAVPGTGCMVVPPIPPIPPKPTVEKAKPKDPKQAHNDKTGLPSNT